MALAAAGAQAEGRYARAVGAREPIRLLVVTPFAETDWRWFGEEFGGGHFRWQFRNLALFGERPWTWQRRALAVAREARDCDVVLSLQAHMTMHLALALQLRGIERPHFAFSFNHGDGRFMRGGTRMLAQRLYRSVRGFVVFSEQEKQIYGDHYGIPRDRFSFVHWAVRPPDVSGELPPYLRDAGPYVACMGHNNRDFELFLDAIDGQGIPAILICRAGRIAPGRLPAGVRMVCDVPEKEAMQVMSKATLSVVPLKDASRGAGHITVVSAMQLGVPQVLTRVPTVCDYFVHGTHGLFVEPCSRDSMRQAIVRLWKDPAERQEMAREARAFAGRWYSEEASRRHLAAYLEAIRLHRCPIPCPPGWGGSPFAATGS